MPNKNYDKNNSTIKMKDIQLFISSVFKNSIG
jgi:hypothetical protein